MDSRQHDGNGGGGKGNKEEGEDLNGYASEDTDKMLAAPPTFSNSNGELLFVSHSCRFCFAAWSHSLACMYSDYDTGSTNENPIVILSPHAPFTPQAAARASAEHGPPALEQHALRTMMAPFWTQR